MRNKAYAWVGIFLMASWGIVSCKKDKTTAPPVDTVPACLPLTLGDSFMSYRLIYTGSLVKNQQLWSKNGSGTWQMNQAYNMQYDGNGNLISMMHTGFDDIREFKLGYLDGKLRNIDIYDSMVGLPASLSNPIYLHYQADGKIRRMNYYYGSDTSAITEITYGSGGVQTILRSLKDTLGNWVPETKSEFMYENYPQVSAYFDLPFLAAEEHVFLFKQAGQNQLLDVKHYEYNASNQTWKSVGSIMYINERNSAGRVKSSSIGPFEYSYTYSCD